MRNDYDLIEKHARMIAETKTEAKTERERAKRTLSLRLVNAYNKVQVR